MCESVKCSELFEYRVIDTGLGDHSGIHLGELGKLSSDYDYVECTRKLGIFPLTTTMENIV